MTKGDINDTVERLRFAAKFHDKENYARSLEWEAAAEIERLRAALDIARTSLLNIERRSEEARAELTRIHQEKP